MEEKRGRKKNGSNQANGQEGNSIATVDRANHLLVIGIDEYSNGIRPLKNAVRDARSFQKVLLERFKFDGKNCIELFNEDATRSAILKAFDDLAEKLTPDDNLLVYFSGHGELIERRSGDKGYWVPADAKLNERGTYVDNFQIRDFFGDLNAHHVLGIVDSCFSGSLLLRDLSASAKRYYNIPSRWIMTSGRKELVSDGRGDNSPFAESLLTQLKNLPKKTLSVSELWIQMREGVVANASQTPLCQPINGSGHQGGEFFFLQKELKSIPEDLVTEIPTLKNPVKSTTTPAPVETSTHPPDPHDNLPAWKKHLQKLIAKDDLDKALDTLYDALSSDSSHHQTLIIRMGGYNSLKKEMAMGIAQNPEMRKAQIKQAILYVIEELEKEDLAEG